jgi:hypothetical protein
MANVAISGDTSGAVTLTVPAVAGTNTITFPAGTGNVSVQGVSTNIVSGTSQASTSGTSIDFTSIPSWVKRVTVMFNGVSINGTAYIRIQLGVSGTPETTGYTSGTTLITNVPSTTTSFSTAGIDIFGAIATYAINGNIVFTNISGNTWTFTGITCNTTTTPYVQQTAGSKALAGTLNMVRITTSNGTDTFDSGSINILYE